MLSFSVSQQLHWKVGLLVLYLIFGIFSVSRASLASALWCSSSCLLYIMCCPTYSHISQEVVWALLVNCLLLIGWLLCAQSNSHRNVHFLVLHITHQTLRIFFAHYYAVLCSFEFCCGWFMFLPVLLVLSASLIIGLHHCLIHIVPSLSWGFDCHVSAPLGAFTFSYPILPWQFFWWSCLPCFCSFGCIYFLLPNSSLTIFLMINLEVQCIVSCSCYYTSFIARKG